MRTSLFIGLSNLQFVSDMRADGRLSVIIANCSFERVADLGWLNNSYRHPGEGRDLLQYMTNLISPRNTSVKVILSPR